MRKRLTIASFVMTVGLVVLGLPTLAMASACDIPGECKGVVETYTPATPAPAPQSASGCWIPGRTNCRMENNSCVCDPVQTKEEELGFLCTNSDPCMNTAVVVVNGKKECLVTPKPQCGSISIPDTAKDPASIGPTTINPSPSSPEPLVDEDQLVPEALEVPSKTDEPAVDPTTGTPDPVKPLDPTADLPPPPLVNIPADDWCKELPAEYQDCCRKSGGSPIDVMKNCVNRDTQDTQDADCSIVINVLGDFTLGDKAQMNLCCQVVNNAGTIEGSSISQECKNAFGGTPDDTKTPSETSTPGGESTDSGDCSEGIIVLGQCEPKDFVHVMGGGDGSGCTLTTDGSGSNVGLGTILLFGLIHLAFLRGAAKRP